MSTSSDAADQIVKYSLDGVEVIAKLSGSGVKNIAAMIFAILNNKKKTKGKTTLTNMLKSEKALNIFSIRRKELKTFAEGAKAYGIPYCVLMDKDKKNPDSIVDIMVKDEDAVRINRVVKKLNLNTVDLAQLKTEVVKTREEKNGQQPVDIGVQEKSKKEQFEDLIAKKPIQKESNTNENFNMEKIEKNPLSKNSSKMSEGVANKKSVREELNEIKDEIRQESDNSNKQKTKVKANTKTKNKNKTKKNKSKVRN